MELFKDNSISGKTLNDLLAMMAERGRVYVSPRIIGGSMEIGGGNSSFHVTDEGLWLGADKFEDAVFSVAMDGGMKLTKGEMSLGTTSSIKGGQTAYNTGIGFFLGYETDAYKLSVGDPNGYHFNFDGANIDIQARHSNLRTFEAIVDASGYGDYTDIQSALTAGKKRIYVRGGTYSLTANITLDDDVLIEGENKYSTIIDLNGAHWIEAIGDTPYSTGTISVTNGSAIITGSGTSWLANLAANDYIVFNQNVYQIVSVDSDTSLTVNIVYEGRTESGISYWAGTFKNNIHIRGLTLKGQSGLTGSRGAIYWYGVVNSSIEDCIITENDLAYTMGIFLRYSSNNILRGLQLSNNGYAGIYLMDYSNSNLLSNINANNNSYEGIYMTYVSYNRLVNIEANNNGQAGIDMKVLCNFNIISNVNVNNNKRWGMYIDFSFANIFNNIEANNNGEEGLFITASNNTFSGLVVEENGYSGIYTYEADRIILSNIRVCNNEQEGIRMKNCSYCKIQGILRDNSQSANNTYNEILIDYEGYSGFSQNNIVTVNILETATNKAKYGIEESVPASWVASTSYAVNDLIIPTTDNGYVYKCTVAGTSGTAEPTWPTTVGDTVTDGTVTWECIRGNDYNLVHGCVIEGPVTGNISLYGNGSVSADNILI